MGLLYQIYRCRTDETDRTTGLHWFSKILRGHAIYRGSGVGAPALPLKNVQNARTVSVLGETVTTL